jgi:DNA-binding response OmpR family regulator
MVRPSCPALVIHDDDPFRKSLIAALDQQHFTVTVETDGESVLDVLRSRKFNVVLLGVNLAQHRGMRALEFLREGRKSIGCGVLVLGDADPALRTLVPWANETLLKPVDATYVATRARTYCDCTP